MRVRLPGIVLWSHTSRRVEKGVEFRFCFDENCNLRFHETLVSIKLSALG